MSKPDVGPGPARVYLKRCFGEYEMCQIISHLNRIEFLCSWPETFQCSKCHAGLCLDHALTCSECDLVLCIECEVVHAAVHEMEELLRNGNLEAGGEA